MALLAKKNYAFCNVGVKCIIYPAPYIYIVAALLNSVRISSFFNLKILKNIS